MPSLPQPGGPPTIVLPPAPAAAPYDTSIRVTPSGFRIAGNTLFTDAQLQPLVQPFVNQATDMEGLLRAAEAVRKYYRDRGYLLTEAYLPQQQFSAADGVVTIQVLEARIGRVAVKVEGEGVSQYLADRIVGTHLHPGDAISEYSLDKPILLLRDLPGYDATATVEPGASVGQADITVTVKPYGPRVDGSLGVDNFGVRSAGQIRAYANANVNNLTTLGDLLSARVQISDRSDSDLYRLGYSIPFNGYASKLGLSATRTEYSLGKQFAPLGAFGNATIVGISASHPFIRSRNANVIGVLTAERKDLEDHTTTPQSQTDRQINDLRLTLLGNFVDNLVGGAFNSYSLNLLYGRLHLDPQALAADQQANGLNTSGSFSKMNLEYVRSMFVSAKGRFVTSLQAQIASKNLTSAEKFGLGGPSGVRGYPVGEALGDAGAIVNLEYQHQLPDFGLAIPVTASVFYDWGHVKFNENGDPLGGPNKETLRSAGFGLSIGTFGKYFLTTQLAWRGSRLPASDPDKRPRVWISFQKWL